MRANKLLNRVYKHKTHFCKNYMPPGGGLNSEPFDYEANALPTELIPDLLEPTMGGGGGFVAPIPLDVYPLN